MDKAHILQEIKRLAGENGNKPPGEHHFTSRTGIQESEWRGIHWAGWDDALCEAGFVPKPVGFRTSWYGVGVWFPIILGPAAVWMGYRAGTEFEFNACGNLVFFASLTGIGGVVGETILLGGKGSGRPGVTQLCCFAFLVYTPPLHAKHTFGLFLAIGLLTPFVVGLAVFPRRGRWASAIGAWLLLFAAIAALTFTVSTSGGNMGFWSAERWRD
jgi:hypothetical protein